MQFQLCFSQPKLKFPGLDVAFTSVISVSLPSSYLFSFYQMTDHKQKKRDVGYPSFFSHFLDTSPLFFHEYFSSHSTDQKVASKEIHRLDINMLNYFTVFCFQFLPVMLQTDDDERHLHE